MNRNFSFSTLESAKTSVYNSNNFGKWSIVLFCGRFYQITNREVKAAEDEGAELVF